MSSSLAEAGDQNGERLRELLQVDKERPDVPVPSCLLGCINQSVFTCKVCDEPYDNIHTFVKHGRVHTDEGSLVCSWCGEEWRSFVSLTIHQMVWQRGGEACPHCGRAKEEKHVCAGTVDTVEPNLYRLRQSDGDKALICPLLCSKASYTWQSLKVHLVTFHGCEKVEAVDDDQCVRADLGPHPAQCPHCQTQVNTDNVRISQHVVLDCSGRSHVVTQHVAGLAGLARDQGLDPLQMVRLELESQLLHWTDVLDSKAGNSGYLDNFLRRGREIDARYSRLPSSFTREFLAWLPRSYTLQVLSSEKDNVLLLFDVWSQVVERLYCSDPTMEEAVLRLEADIQHNIREESLPDWDQLNEETGMEEPDMEIVNKLEAELGWSNRQTLAI